MTDACVPTGGAEDGSLHWIRTPSGIPRVWTWGGEFGFWNDGTDAVSPQGFYALGGRYIGPASPDDAAALAEARAQNDTLVKAHAELVVENYNLRAQISALEKTNSKLKRVAEIILESAEETGMTRIAEYMRIVLEDSKEV